MRSNILRAVTCLIAILLLAVSAVPAFADSGADAKAVIDGIISYNLNKSGAATVQEWIDGALSDSAGSASEWYAVALKQYGNYDLSTYEAALSRYLLENEVHSASSRLKYALALAAAGSEDSYIENTVNDSVGEQGVMSFIFGLHLMNNGYTGTAYTPNQVKDALLSLQLDDGGWAVMGNTGDVDVTAMAVQALAPHYGDEPVRSAVDKALTLLSERQQDTGDYKSYGVGNAESTAQVLVALSALGIDCTADSRFMKDGNTIFDGIMLYSLPDGTFSHAQGEDLSETATVQVFYSMVAYLRMVEGKTPLFVLDESGPGDTAVQTAEPNAAVTESVNGADNDDSTDSSVSYKLWVCLGIGTVAGVICGIMLCIKKNPRNILLILVIAVSAVCAVLFTDIQRADDYYNNAAVSEKDAIGTVSLAIRCDTVAGRGDHIPYDGIILEPTAIAIADNDTVYDVLAAATAANRIHLETNGTGGSVYVEGIANIYEFDFGNLSGWVYRVNGDSLSVSCGEYEPSDGDVIEWLYSCRLGDDVE